MLVNANMHTRDIPQERREKFALLGSNDYIMLPSGEIRRKIAKQWRNKAEKKAYRKAYTAHRLDAQEEMAVERAMDDWNAVLTP